MATWTYSTTPFDNIARLRLMIGDTDVSLDALGVPTVAQFSDEELQEFLTQAGGSIIGAAITALEAWMGALSRELKSEKIGDYSYTRNTIEHMQKLKDQLIEKEASTPVQEISEWNLSGVEDDEDVE